MTHSGAEAYDDVAAIGGCAAGESAALEELFTQHGSTCLALARLVAADAAHAEAAVRAAYLHLWENAATFDSCESVRGRLLVLTHELAAEGGAEEPRRRARRAGTPASRARAALSALPADEREAVLLAACGGFSERDIAGLTGSSIATTRGRIHVAMKSLSRAARTARRSSSAGPRGRRASQPRT